MRESKEANEKTEAVNAKLLNMTRKPKRSPSFFKVLVGDFVTKLKIPPAFVKYVLKGKVPKKFSLYSDSGNSWRVRVEVQQGSYFFNSGWSKFVKYHGLEIGDFLVFFLVDSSTFDVFIYNRTACAKNSILAAKKPKGRPPGGNRQIEQTPSQKCTSASKKPRAVSRARNVSQEVEFITEEAPKHVSFVLVVKKYLKYYVFIPRYFAKETGLGKESITMIKGPRGGMWPMNTTESGRQVRLGGGWSQFLHENDIVVGDTLLFQHIPNAGNLVHVQILNKAGYRNHGRGGRRGRQNKQANASEKNTIIAIKQKRGPPCRQIEEPNSKITKGLSIEGETDITRKDEFESELTPKKASFVVVLKQYQKFYIPVPTSVAKEMGLTKEPSTVIKDSKGRKWRLNILVYARSVHLGAGWSKFMEENKLEVGDTLLFQHIPNTGNVIYFHIIRKARDGNHGKRKN
ncbi:hypothetical protein ES319_A02G174500v1 [Gossypium barbadense]|uniref:TF-B3 domain-containing protein n=1 Tax=Gossypium barbadense TaxID=3634 RepID=A0A5J5WSG2_GOSBA|nr:hypothetical protein ES319_A02G174500v1 [Gossypium barbadense]